MEGCGSGKGCGLFITQIFFSMHPLLVGWGILASVVDSLKAKHFVLVAFFILIT